MPPINYVGAYDHTTLHTHALSSDHSNSLRSTKHIEMGTGVVRNGHFHSRCRTGKNNLYLRPYRTEYTGSCIVGLFIFR